MAKSPWDVVGEEPARAAAPKSDGWDVVGEEPHVYPGTNQVAAEPSLGQRVTAGLVNLVNHPIDTITDTGTSLLRGLGRAARDAPVLDPIRRGSVGVFTNPAGAALDTVNRTIVDPLTRIGARAADITTQDGVQASPAQKAAVLRQLSPTVAAQDELRGVRQAMAEEAQAEQARIGARPTVSQIIENPEDAAYRIGQRIISTSAESAPALVAALATRNPQVGGALMGGQTGTQTYLDLVDQGVDPRRAAEVAALTGGVEAAGEQLGLEHILGGRGVAGALGAAVAEGGQEAPVSLAQGYLSDQATGKETPISEQLWQAIEAAGGGALLGGGANLATQAPALLRRDTASPSVGPGPVAPGAEPAPLDPSAIGSLITGFGRENTTDLDALLASLPNQPVASGGAGTPVDAPAGAAPAGIGSAIRDAIATAAVPQSPQPIPTDRGSEDGQQAEGRDVLARAGSAPGAGRASEQAAGLPPGGRGPADSAAAAGDAGAARDSGSAAGNAAAPSDRPLQSDEGEPGAARGRSGAPQGTGREGSGEDGIAAGVEGRRGAAGGEVVDRISDDEAAGAGSRAERDATPGEGRREEAGQEGREEDEAVTYTAADFLPGMGTEVGWSQRGGELMRDRREGDDDLTNFGGRPTGDVIGRTAWVAKPAPDGTESRLWRERPDKGLNEARAQAALDKAGRGEKLSPIEQRFVDHATALATEYAETANRESAAYRAELATYDAAARASQRQAMRDEIGDVDDATADEALALDDLVHRAYSAGAEPEAILDATFDGTPAEQARALWRMIAELEVSRGPDTEAAERGSAGSAAPREEGRAAGAQPRQPAAGLFGAPSAREVVDAEARRRDAERDGRTGTGRTDMAAGGGELFAGPRPQQESLEDVSVRDRLAERRAEREAERATRAASPEAEAVRLGNEDADAKGFREPVRRALGALADRVEFHRGYAGLPERLRKGIEARAAARGGRGKTSGLYDQATGKVYLFTDALSSPERAAFTAAHEIAGHHGLRALLGDKLDPALGIARQNPTVKAVADAIAGERNIDQKSQKGILLATEEALAELAAAVRTGDYGQIESRYDVPVPEGVRASLTRAIDNFLKRLRAMIDDLFGRHVFTDEDVRALLENAWQAAGGDTASVVDGRSDPLEQTVFHGTPHAVDRFSLQKIGTGEGAQAYGWGLYFAGKRSVAEHYRDRLTDSTAPVHTVTIRGQRVAPDSPEGHGARLVFHNSKPEMKRLAKQMLADAKAGDAYAVDTAQKQGIEPVEYYTRVARTIDDLKKSDIKVHRGRLYEVDIPEDSDLIDNEASIAKQNEKVKEVARQFLIDEGYLREGQNGDRQLASAFKEMGREKGGIIKGPDGQLLYEVLAKKLGGEQAASQYFNEHGVPGLKYKAGQIIQGGKNQGHNYVIWDEAAISEPEQILESVEPGSLRDLSSRLRYSKSSIEEMRELAGTAKRLIGEVAVAPDFEQDVRDARAALNEARRNVRQDTGRAQLDALQDASRELDEAEQSLRDLKAKEAAANRALDALARRQADMSLAEREALAKLLDELATQEREAADRRRVLRERVKRLADAKAAAETRREEAAQTLGVSRGTAGWNYDTGVWEGVAGSAKRARMNLQDKMTGWEDVQNQIAGQVGQAIPDAQNVYQAENLMHGRTGEAIRRLEDSHIKPLMQALKAAKVSVPELEEYLYARHAEERNQQIARINPDMPDGGSGMSTAQARSILANARPEMAALAQRVDVMTKATRRRLLEHGLIDQATFDAMEAAYQHYVPLRGKRDGEEVQGTQGGAGRGLDTRRAPTKRALGRGEGNLAENILAEVVGDAMRSIVTAEKARVGRAVMRLVLANPNPDLWTVEPVQTERALDSEGQVYERVLNDWNDPSVIGVRHNGKLYKVQINQPELAQALNHVGVEQIGALTRVAGMFNRYLSAMLTKYNPAFTGVNAVRDALFGLTGMAAERGEGAALRAALKYPFAAVSSFKAAHGKLGNSPMDQMAAEFAEHGGRTGYVNMPSVEDISRKIGNGRITSYSPSGLARAASTVAEQIDHVNDAVENALRLSAYATLREDGVSPEQAATYAKNLTVNFNRKGLQGSAINSWFLFYNASIQGSKRFADVARKPKTWAYLGVLATAQVLATMAMLGMEDDDGTPLWDKIPDHVKARNLVLPAGKDGTHFMTVPMPYGFNMMTWGAGRFTDAFARPKKKQNTAGQIAADTVSNMVQAFAPVPLDDGALGAVPTALRIPLAVQVNRDSFDRPIRREDPYAQAAVPRASMGRPDTIEIFKATASGLNRIGGGDEYTPAPMSAFDRAPEDLEFISEQLTGGAGRFVLDTARAAGTIADPGAELEPRKTPIANKFFANVSDVDSNRSQFYDRRESIETALRRVRTVARQDGVAAAQKLMASMPELTGARLKRNASGAIRGGGKGEVQFEGAPGSLFAKYKAAAKATKTRGEKVEDAYNEAPATGLPSAASRARDKKIRAADLEAMEAQRAFNAAWNKATEL